MKRRDFVALAGGAALSPLLAGCSGQPTLSGAAGLVDTPEKRQAYLEALLKEICAIGPRPIGSPGYDQGAEIFLREMRRGIPDAFLEKFTFERWVLQGQPELTIDGSKLETYPGHGTSGTPPEGLRGTLRKSEDIPEAPYAVVDSAGKTVAALSVSPYGRAVPRPWYTYKQEFKCLPIFNIGKQDVAQAEEAVQNRLPVFLKDEVQFIPDSSSMNVVGSLPGATEEEILFLGHLDTVYNTPGANDNTASALALLMLALAFSGSGPLKRRLTFVATSGEEYDKQGAIAHAGAAKKAGTFGNIKYLVNVDSATWGPNMQIFTADNQLWQMVQDIDTQLELPGVPVLAGDNGFDLDGRPFLETGARAMYVNSTGYNLNHLWHRPEDTADTVPTDCVEIFFRLMQEYLKRLQAL